MNMCQWNTVSTPTSSPPSILSGRLRGLGSMVLASHGAQCLHYWLRIIAEARLFHFYFHLFIFPLWQAEPNGVEWSTAEVQRACTLPEGVITCFTSPPLTPTLIPSKPIISVPNIMGCGAKFPAPVTSPNRISVLRIFLSDAHRRGKCAIFTSPHDSGHVSGERKNGINLGYITHLISDIKKQP